MAGEAAQKTRKLIVIVQDRPTQFDVPFYAFNDAEGAVDIRVYYTAVRAGAVDSPDRETGVTPRWDHLAKGTAGDARVAYVAGRGVAALVSDIAAQRPDLVIVCGYMPVTHALLALGLKLRGLKVGLRSDNTLQHSRFAGLKGVVKRAILPLWLRLYDSWHPVGTLATDYLRTLARTKRPVFLFPYNVDNAWFMRKAAAHREQRDAWRAGMGWGQGDFVVLGVMKWHPREDPLTLIDAFAQLQVRQPGARLILVGDGPMKEQVAGRLRPMQGRVHAPGYVSYSELPRLYAMSDVFVHPAVGEPWGVSVNEAMACGLPVLAASGVGAGKDLIVEGETGFVFPDRDSGKLAALMELLVSDVDLRQRMSVRAFDKMTLWSYGQTTHEMARAVHAG